MCIEKCISPTERQEERWLYKPGNNKRLGMCIGTKILQVSLTSHPNPGINMLLNGKIEEQSFSGTILA